MHADVIEVDGARLRAARGDATAAHEVDGQHGGKAGSGGDYNADSKGLAEVPAKSAISVSSPRYNWRTIGEASTHHWLTRQSWFHQPPRRGELGEFGDAGESGEAGDDDACLGAAVGTAPGRVSVPIWKS